MIYANGSHNLTEHPMELATQKSPCKKEISNSKGIQLLNSIYSSYV